jgi:hypothetical protein
MRVCPECGEFLKSFVFAVSADRKYVKEKLFAMIQGEGEIRGKELKLDQLQSHMNDL